MSGCPREHPSSCSQICRLPALAEAEAEAEVLGRLTLTQELCNLVPLFTYHRAAVIWRLREQARPLRRVCPENVPSGSEEQLLSGREGSGCQGRADALLCQGH